MNLQFDLVSKLKEGLKEGAEKLVIPDPVTWIEKEFHIPETRNDPKLRGRIKLMKYQEDVIREVFSKNENGDFKYSIIVWSDIKKSAKSSIAAAVNVYRAFHMEYGEFYVVANDLKQADSRVAHYIRRAIQLNPKLRDKFKINGYRITSPTGSFIEAIPIDPSGEAGGNADMITWSELWGSNETAKQNMWVEQTLPPAKFGRSFRWIESYAGFSEESDLLYSLYDLGVKQGHMLWPDKLYDVTDGEPSPLELYVNEEASMLCLWNTVPRCPWQTKAYYRTEEQILPPNQFQRIHRNQWVTSSETFVPMAWVYACLRTNDEWPAINAKRQPMIIAMDAATSNDNFALFMGCRHPTRPDEILTIYAKKWAPSKHTGKIDFVGTEDKPGPEMVLRDLIKRFNVIQVCYDPYQLHSLSTSLKQEGLAWFKSFNQGTDRLIADSGLRDLIRDRRFWHRNEPDLIEHLGNANAKIDDQDSKIRIVKRADRLKIDLAVAASMCCHELLRLNL
jgi:phage terminase large subunit-like protein